MILEAGEECDCGYGSECTDPCCQPANEKVDNDPNACKLTTKAKAVGALGCRYNKPSITRIS